MLNGDAAGCIGAGNPDACCTGAGTGSCSPYVGYTDWRLPNINELQSLVNYGTLNPAVHVWFNNGCVAACTVLTCSCTQLSVYWSSTSYLGSPSHAWRLFFNDGHVGSGTKTNNLYVRAVRSGS